MKLLLQFGRVVLLDLTLFEVRLDEEEDDEELSTVSSLIERAERHEEPEPEVKRRGGFGFQQPGR